MALDIYGGDPRIIATQHELLRIASLLEQAASHLEEAWLAPPETFLDGLALDRIAPLSFLPLAACVTCPEPFVPSAVDAVIGDGGCDGERGG